MEGCAPRRLPGPMTLHTSPTALRAVRTPKQAFVTGTILRSLATTLHTCGSSRDQARLPVPTPFSNFPVSNDNGTTITINPVAPATGWTTAPVAGPPHTLRPGRNIKIIPNSSTITVPTWPQRTNDPNFGTNPFVGMVSKPPALVEITLELTDQGDARDFSFTQRFYIPASER